MKRLLLVLLLSFFLIPISSTFAQEKIEQEVYVIFDEVNRKIPKKYFWYNEKLPGDLNAIELESSEGWTNKRQFDRSYTKGFWLRYKIKNDIEEVVFGIDRENFFPKTFLIYIGLIPLAGLFEVIL